MDKKDNEIQNRAYGGDLNPRASTTSRSDRSVHPGDPLSARGEDRKTDIKKAYLDSEFRRLQHANEDYEGAVLAARHQNFESRYSQLTSSFKEYLDSEVEKSSGGLRDAENAANLRTIENLSRDHNVSDEDPNASVVACSNNANTPGAFSERRGTSTRRTADNITVPSTVEENGGDEEVAEDRPPEEGGLVLVADAVVVPERTRRLLLGVLVGLVVVVVGVAVGVPLGIKRRNDESAALSTGGSTLPPTASGGTQSPNAEPSTAPSDSPSPTQSPWQRLGQDVEGEGTFDYFGWSVSLSRDATVMAVGARECVLYCESLHAGYVVVYRLDASSQSWVPLGQEIQGQADRPSSSFGQSLALNGAGNILAIGANEHDADGTRAGQVRVYQYNTASSQWAMMGTPLDGSGVRADFGVSVSLSDDGLLLAVGAPFEDGETTGDIGYVQVFQFDTGTQSWEQLGQKIEGAPGRLFGWSVSLNKLGTIVGIGVREGGFTGRGEAVVYQYNSSSFNWTILGEPLQANETVGSKFGYAVSLDDTGLILAVSDRYSDLGGSMDTGSVAVFAYDGDLPNPAWIRRGQPLAGEGEFIWFGRALSLGSNGNMLAVGAPGGDDSGLVYIFEYDVSDTLEWIQVGPAIPGEVEHDWSGWAVHLSGTVVAIGSPRNTNGGDEVSGHVRVFTFKNEE